MTYGNETAREHPTDTSSLRIIFMAGSQLGADLCVRATETFGPVLYNLYGSTEVAYATIGTPDELARYVQPPRGWLARIAWRVRAVF